MEASLLHVLSFAAGLAVAAIAVHYGSQKGGQDAANTIQALREAEEKAKRLRQEERRGRIRAEKALKEALQRAPQDEKPRDFSLHVTAIGVVRSPFCDRRGTPRQPQLAPSVQGVIEVTWHPEGSLRGVEEFGYIWVIFAFHGNTNMHQATCKATVAPPALGGIKLGVFACRTPHRPNPIGLSLVRVCRVDGNRIHILGHDLLDGTPVLDIKPYLPHVEAIPNATLPVWARQPEDLSVTSVTWGSEAEQQRRLLAVPDDTTRALNEILAWDIRNLHQRQHGEFDTTYVLNFDTFRLNYKFDPSTKTVTVVAVCLATH